MPVAIRIRLKGLIMKQKMTARELTTLIMQEVRQHPEWDDIMDVSIRRPVQSAPHHPNWDAAFTMNGPRVAPAAAFTFVKELQAKFELEL